MMYKLINRQTGEQYLCDKVTIDGFNYYVSDEKEQVVLGRFYYEHDNHVPIYSFTECTLPEQYYLPQVIATTNPNIDDVPKVVDEVEKFENEYFKDFSWGSVGTLKECFEEMKKHYWY